MDNKIKVRNGNLELFLSNSIIINANEPVILHLEGDKGEETLELIFKFQNRPDKKVDRIINIKSETKMEISFINFNNVLSTYSSSIWELGTIKKRKLYVYYSVRDFAKSDMKQFDYTFYLGEEVPNG